MKILMLSDSKFNKKNRNHVTYYRHFASMLEGEI